MINKRTGQHVLEKVETARDPWAANMGLVYRPLRQNEGLWLTSNWAHTYGLRQPLDLLFLSRDNEVVKIVHAIKPNTVSPRVAGASSVIEMTTGMWPHDDVKVHDVLEAVETPV